MDLFSTFCRWIQGIHRKRKRERNGWGWGWKSKCKFCLWGAQTTIHFLKKNRRGTMKEKMEVLPVRRSSHNTLWKGKFQPHGYSSQNCLRRSLIVVCFNHSTTSLVTPSMIGNSPGQGWAHIASLSPWLVKARGLEREGMRVHRTSYPEQSWEKGHLKGLFNSCFAFPSTIWINFLHKLWITGAMATIRSRCGKWNTREMNLCQPFSEKLTILERSLRKKMHKTHISFRWS